MSTALLLGAAVSLTDVAEVGEELAAHEGLQDEVDVGVVLEGRVQLGDHGVVEHLHDLELVEEVLLEPGFYDPLLGLWLEGLSRRGSEPSRTMWGQGRI